MSCTLTVVESTSIRVPSWVGVWLNLGREDKNISKKETGKKERRRERRRFFITFKRAATMEWCVPKSVFPSELFLPLEWKRLPTFKCCRTDIVALSALPCLPPTRCNFAVGESTKSFWMISNEEKVETIFLSVRRMSAYNCRAESLRLISQSLARHLKHKHLMQAFIFSWRVIITIKLIIRSRTLEENENENEERDNIYTCMCGYNTEYINTPSSNAMNRTRSSVWSLTEKKRKINFHH